MKHIREFHLYEPARNILREGGEIRNQQKDRSKSEKKFASSAEEAERVRWGSSEKETFGSL